MKTQKPHTSQKKQAEYKLPAVPTDNAFLTSPADVPGPRKVDLQDADIKPSTRSAFDALCEKYPRVFSKGNDDIGFDDTQSHMDIASAFKCNVSQLSKAVTGIDYASGPHNYKPKEKKTPTKRTSDGPHPNPEKAKKAPLTHPTTSQL